MKKATIEIIETGKGSQVAIEVSFNGEQCDQNNPAHLCAIRIAEAIHRGEVHEQLSASGKPDIVTTH
ncbi:hypothetical protein [uncultured Endozoicomonas sp.]|uniref:hypothetical protein n=1 Tax=uncultured Endozoicomonas sp. TaxID=432652 RepID=UPI00260F0D60|nr:hypothetical protein [uncultured Endozoicomonas sp.]